MTRSRSRREFLRISTAAACLGPPIPINPSPAPEMSAAAKLHDASRRNRKAVQIGMLPKALSYTDRFKLARDVGFEGVEAETVEDPRAAEAVQRASETAHLPIHSVMNIAHWKFPLSSGDSAIVKESLDGMITSLHNAKLWKAEAVLLVPAVVDANTGYAEAWKRSQANIRRLIPLAEELKVVIAIEEVWNKFLLSPLEMARYVDEFQSPWVQHYFDVGNVVLCGYPQDWILTLNTRIAKIHLKDFRREKGSNLLSAQFVNLGEGDIDWAALRNALAAVGYRGWVTTELEPGGEAYLRDVVKRIDRLLGGVDKV